MTPQPRNIPNCEQDGDIMYCGMTRYKSGLTTRGRGERLSSVFLAPWSPAQMAHLRFIGALLLLSFVAALAWAQRGDIYNSIGSTTDTTRAYEKRSGGAIVLVSVFAADGKTRLDRQAVVKATNQTAHTVNWQTTDDRSEAPMELMVGVYEIEVGAVGYLSEQKQLSIVTASSTIRIEIALHPDPSAMDLRIADADMPAKARKEARQAVSSLKSGNLKNARKKLDAAD